MQKDKARDIGRGVLPSKARKGARENKRGFHARQRAAQRQAIRSMHATMTVVDEIDGYLYTDPDLYDDFEDPEIFDGYHARTTKSAGWDNTMTEIVRDRRGADKLGPLIHWAEATERQVMQGWSDDDKESYFRSVLPDTLQGRHALGHVKDALGIGYRRWWRFDRPPAMTKDEFRGRLTSLLSTKSGRRSLRDFLQETVPVAAHAVESNLKITKQVGAVDENGNPRYGTISSPTTVYLGQPLGRGQRQYRIMVDVEVPKIIKITCDDCRFLRNDPLATPEAVNRFVDIVWYHNPDHDFTGKIRQHVISH